MLIACSEKHSLRHTIHHGERDFVYTTRDLKNKHGRAHTASRAAHATPASSSMSSYVFCFDETSTCAPSTIVANP